LRLNALAFVFLVTAGSCKIHANDLSSVTKVMGPLPHIDYRSRLNIQTLEEVKLQRYIRRKITFSAEPGSIVYAWLLVPSGAYKATRCSLPSPNNTHRER
jgi:hypothetical protein